MRHKNLVKNTTWLFIFNLAKITFPFITLPYLTRVFSTDTYGATAYVKTVMSYLQIFVDFGFVLSGTKDVVLARHNHTKLNRVVSDTLFARIILGLCGFIIVAILGLCIPLLRENFLFTMLSYVAVFMSIFLFDFLFRGLEKMHIIAIRFILMKTISTILTFILVRNDSQMLLIPIFDILSTLAAIILVGFEFHKLHLHFVHNQLKAALAKIKTSFTFFLSNAAATSFNAFSTIVIGILLSPTDVAFWSICVQIIGTIQACYAPISEGIFPEMVRTKNLQLINKILRIFTPLIIIGCIILFLAAPIIIQILGGETYSPAALILQILIPCLIFGFCAIIIGWPALGAINKQREVTFSTIISVLINIFILFILIFTNNFNLISIALARVFADFTLFAFRLYFLVKNRKLFIQDYNYES